MTKMELIQALCRDFQQNSVELIVLRKSGRIPGQLTLAEDIDILCHRQGREKIKRIFKAHGFLFTSEDVTENIYLYGSFPHDYFTHQQAAICFDAAYSLSYRSLNRGEWIPVSGSIQRSIWEHKRHNNFFFVPSETDELLHLICHCLLDKRAVDAYYEKRIGELFAKAQQKELAVMLEKIFQKFSPRIVELISGGDQSRLFEEYITFRDY